MRNRAGRTFFSSPELTAWLCPRTLLWRTFSKKPPAGRRSTAMKSRPSSSAPRVELINFLECLCDWRPLIDALAPSRLINFQRVPPHSPGMHALPRAVSRRPSANGLPKRWRHFVCALRSGEYQEKFLAVLAAADGAHHVALRRRPA